MSHTVGSLIRMFGRQQLDVDISSTLSEKKWTSDYHPLYRETVRGRLPTRQELTAFLSPETLPSKADSLGLATPAHMLNTQQLELMTEGDVTHDFDQNIIPLVELAFSGESAVTIPARGDAPVPGGPKLSPRSLVASKNSSSSKKVVDYQMTMSHEIKLLESPAIIGELKRPRIIKRKEWAFEQNPSETTIRLIYAHLYECPQVFLFDSKTLVLVQFRAQSTKKIANECCGVDVCIIPREEFQLEGQCSMAEGLYALALRGFTRLCATRGWAERERGEYERHYEFYSGRPIWKDRQGRVYHGHSYGYRRDLDFRLHQQSNKLKVYGYWVWLDSLGNSIVDDTKNCFTTTEIFVL
ncbi:hypothetical protein ASPACDRAFT_1892258 [Aspergillus aculeatus ATCC 16872]|uniref:Uncharacterized protein n=1 Tax=Aspergillus aculeatus (strain ATCC 16872 / CBS 172.66 / WB 5094) TaxID=690307 RepID=A0A1L9WF02_ASPA1|nr:uncharacterized protein ASPACDRAFT_1892258 [Aspergillus aculeatus ATCC 16872]OJJ94759.1 hypothetical protein ASPACDRAFT_1892258 [Aspergillus aculeatus ATCC 16872]